MTTRPSNSTPRCASKIMKPGVQTKTRSQMLAAAPVTTAERRKQPKGPSVDEWTNGDVVSPDNGILFGHKKEWGSDTHSMDEPPKYYAR